MRNLEDDRSYARQGFIQPHTHLRIGLESYIEYLELLREINTIKGDLKIEFVHEGDYDEKLWDLSFKADNKVIITTVFLTSFIESYLFDYSGIMVGQTETKKYIEKLSVEAKIVLVPRIISGLIINRSENYFRLLKEMISFRNDIIHLQTKDFTPPTKQQMADYDPKHVFESTNLLDFFNALYDYLKILDESDPQQGHLSKLQLQYDLKEKLNTFNDVLVPKWLK